MKQLVSVFFFRNRQLQIASSKIVQLMMALDETCLPKADDEHDVSDDHGGES